MLAGAACGGGSQPAETTTGAATTGLSEDEEIAGVLTLFVEAAGRGDAEAMWGLLSEQSREQLGPTLEEFAAEYATGFEEGVGAFAGTPYEVLLSDVTPSGWGIGAIAGDRPGDGEPEYAAYAAMLVEEGTGWRLELGDPVAVRLLAPVGQTDEKQPQIRFSVEANAAVEEAGLWVDGEPVAGTVEGSGEQVRIAGTPAKPLAPGRHVVVVFGRSGSNATAGASPFVVESGPSA